MSQQSTSLSFLEALRGGSDEQSWARLVAGYQTMLLSFAKRLGLSDADACDAVQETFAAVLAAFRGMPEPFDRSRGRFRSWMRGIAKHKVLDIKKARRKHSHAELLPGTAGGASVASLASPVSQDEIDQAFDREWRLNQVAQALEQVRGETDPVVYQAFFLTFVDEQEPARVADLLGVTRNAVYVSKCKILRRLRDILSRIEFEEA